jgi:hypothetical protein
MRRILPVLGLAALLALPAAAQEGPEAEEDSLEEGMDLLGRGAEMFLRGLMDEIEPQLRRLEPELRGLAEDIGPMIARLVEMIDDIDAYHPPERLPNGDIILRRREPAEPESDPAPAPEDPPAEGQIDI